MLAQADEFPVNGAVFRNALGESGHELNSDQHIITLIVCRRIVVSLRAWRCGPTLR